MAKIYIASGFNLVSKVEKVSKTLEDNGHKVLVKWWKKKDLKEKLKDLSEEEFYNHFENQVAYERDFEGVKECDVFLLVADDKKRKYTGANIELGIALANQKRCMSLGKLMKSAMYYPVYRAKNLGDVLETLELFEKYFGEGRNLEAIN